jgi:flotillin
VAENRNTYLDQVVERQEQLADDLRSGSVNRPGPGPGMGMGMGMAESFSALAEPALAGMRPGSPSPSRPRAGRRASGSGSSVIGGGRSEERAVEVRVTGIGRWKTVLVPPNALVVHTRRGQAEPLHVGLGVSFRYNPATDSFLVVPAAMQTILLNAYCICRELQGVVVQAYVQWIIQDFATAYRKLDFRDPYQPMRLVNLQLKEQAEAAIKDKVATMGIHEVLSDRQPIIEELTARLRAVAEGEGADAGQDQGLGLRIVTVQIKEAIVSSTTLWQNLQMPYRAEQERLAALAKLAADASVAQNRLGTEREQETRRIANEQELGELRAQSAAAQFERDAADRAHRDQKEQEISRAQLQSHNETTVYSLDLERQVHEQKGEMARLRQSQEQQLKQLAQDAELELTKARKQAEHEQALLALDLDRARATIDNERTPASIQGQLVSSLPRIVEKMPTPTEYRSVNLSGNDTGSLAGLVAELGAIVGALHKGDTAG